MRFFPKDVVHLFSLADTLPYMVHMASKTVFSSFFFFLKKLPIVVVRDVCPSVRPSVCPSVRLSVCGNNFFSR